ncbi:beta-defensin 50-like [Arvicanthis niloticus]|uniref:beta-defensin 50-like n=1 Tax=Arvicanthis niloticus TaxID=61156 RepID=UPI001485E5FE|nr:beta-defensin 50-like [Arvicanthis niloticus]
MKTFWLLLLTSGLLSLMVTGVDRHPGTVHVRFKCIPKTAAGFGDNCPFYGSVDSLCNNTKSVCCMVPVRLNNI